MKSYIYFYLSFVCTLFACSRERTDFVVRGQFPGLQDGMSVTLVNTEARGGDSKTIATDTVRNGRFELQGALVSPVMCQLRISNKPLLADPKESKTLGTRLFLDNSEVEIQTPCFDSLYYISEFSVSPRELLTRIAGSRLQADYMAYREALHDSEAEYLDCKSELSALSFDYQFGKYPEEEYNRRMAEGYGKIAKAAARFREARLAFVRSHRQSPLALYVAQQLLAQPFEITDTELAELVELTAGVADSVRMPRFRKQAVQAQTYCKNAPYTDVPLYTPAGKRDSLSGYLPEGRVTLIDCWASWCGSCRSAIPDVQKLYDQYDRDRFNVISISLDEKKESWQRAMKEEKMPWAQFIVDEEGFDRLTDNYHFQSIPRLILIDGKGRVVCTTNSPEEIKVELEKVMASL